MNVLLINPPQAHFTQPLLALPSLAAYLRRAGVGNVAMIDASIESYDDFLSPARLSRALSRVRAKERLGKLDALPSLHFSAMEEYQLISEVAVAGEAIVAGIEESKRVLRDRNSFYDYPNYLRAARTIEQGLRLFSAEYAPTKLTAHGFVMRNSIERSSEIVAALDDEAHNPYVEWFRERLMPRIREMDPDLIGISVTFGSQAIPAFTLAKQIKAWKPGCHVTMGGGLLAYVARKLAEKPPIWDCIDSFVMLEGERPLEALCQAVKTAKGRAVESTKDGNPDLSKIPNLIYRDRATGKVVSTPEVEPLDIQSLPTPDFDGLPLDRYFSPELVLPLAITRGCYWGKCVFCTLYTVIGPGYRGRSVERTIDDLKELREKYHTKHFYMVIEDLPPNMAKRLPRAILDAGLDIDWWCDARLEHDVFDEPTVKELAKSGCKRIAFGYESASQRVLDRMCKGIDPVRSMQLIHRCHDAGISVTLYVMVGFPTETREEAEHTLSTILANRQKIQEVSVRVFYLDETSEIYRRAKEFDIQSIHADPEADLQVYYDFTPGSGMDRREARRMYLRFTSALTSHFPVFQNTNMLYHELKSHYFLYLSRFGSWEALLHGVLERAEAGGAADSERPRRDPRLRFLNLRFDRGEVDSQLSAIDSATLRPRYQADLVEDADRARFDRDLEPADPSESYLVYAPETAEIHALSRAAGDLLLACDGRRTVDELLAAIPAPYRNEARKALTQAARLSLLEPQRSAERSLHSTPSLP